MPDLTTIARWMIVLGLSLAGLGAILWVIARLGLPFGKLPGDIFIQGENASCFFPLASMLILSLLLTLLANILIRLLNR
jgi:hypothetical protein